MAGESLLRALRAKVYAACTWDVLHLTDDCLARFANPSNCEKGTLLVPGNFGAMRRTVENAAGRALFPDAVYGGIHSVIDVPPGGETFTLSKLRVRGDVRYVFHAAKAGKITFKGRLMKVGKKSVSDATLEMRSLNGGDAVKVRVPVGKEAKDFTVEVPAAGFYSLGADLGPHVFQLYASEVPVGLDVSERPASIQTSAGDVWFSVRGGEPFNAMVSGQVYGERVGAELFDPSGKSVWSAPSAIWWNGWRGRAAANGLWRLSLTRPKEGRFEDYRVDMTGAAGVLFLSSDKHW